jgi:hypothetical protein
VPDVTNSVQFYDPRAMVPLQAYDTPSGLVLPLSIAASSSYVSNLLFSSGFAKMALVATLSGVGTLSVQRFVDPSGLVPQAAVSSVNLTANTPNVLNVIDGLPFTSFVITVANTTAGALNLTTLAILLQGL